MVIVLFTKRALLQGREVKFGHAGAGACLVDLAGGRIYIEVTNLRVVRFLVS